MNAANPLEMPKPAGSDPRSFEPSMEEILASIRRIISDDQAAPKRGTPRDIPALRADTRDMPTPYSEASTAPVHLLKSDFGAVEMPDNVRTDSASEEPDSGQLSPMVAQGIVAAPQFASPEHVAQDSAVPLTNIGQAAVQTPRPDIRTASSMMEPAATIPTAPSLSASVGEKSAEKPVGSFEPSNADERSSAQDSADLFSARTNQSVTSAFNVLAATRLADHSEELLDLSREMLRPLLRTWLDDNLPSMVERLVRAEIERVARGRR